MSTVGDNDNHEEVKKTRRAPPREGGVVVKTGSRSKSREGLMTFFFGPLLPRQNPKNGNGEGARKFGKSL